MGLWHLVARDCDNNIIIILILYLLSVLLEAKTTEENINYLIYSVIFFRNSGRVTKCFTTWLVSLLTLFQDLFFFSKDGDFLSFAWTYYNTCRTSLWCVARKIFTWFSICLKMGTTNIIVDAILIWKLFQVQMNSLI